MLKRLFLVKIILSIFFLIIIFRLAFIMFLEHEVYLSKARSQHIKKEEIFAKRGNIYDRKGRQLAVSLEKDSIFIDPSEIKNENLQILASYINFDEERIKTFDKTRRFIWIARKVDYSLAEKIKAFKLAGVGFVPEGARFYPNGYLASHVIGFVNVDDCGIEGIEKYYDNYLRVQKSSKIVLRDAAGKKLSDGNFWEIKGNDIILTIDEGLQYIVEKHLDEAMKKWNASSATAIMMNPFTGEILAMANRPTYDPNNFSSVKDMAYMRNRAITDLYEPGSTFKIVTAVAALEENIVNPSSKFDCSPGYIDIGGKRIKDVHRYGVLTFEEIIQKSSNVGTIKIAMKLGREKLYQYIRKFGFGEKTGIDLPGEVSGYIKAPEKWSGTSLGAVPIGQEVAVTALQLLRAYSAIANGGFLVNPYIVSEIRDPDGKILYTAVIKRKRIISEKTAQIMKNILKKVTQEGGTATQAKLDGNEVAGKTGTAQKYDLTRGRYSKDKFVASFVGFILAQNSNIALIVVVHDPKGAHFGGVVAAPIFKAISDEALSYLNVPRDDVKEKGLIVKFNNENNEVEGKLVIAR